MNALCHKLLFINFLYQFHDSIAKSKDIKGKRGILFLYILFSSLLCFISFLLRIVCIMCKSSVPWDEHYLNIRVVFHKNKRGKIRDYSNIKGLFDTDKRDKEEWRYWAWFFLVLKHIYKFHTIYLYVA